MGDFRLKVCFFAVLAMTGFACRADAQSISDAVFPQPGSEAVGVWLTEVSPGGSDEKGIEPWSSKVVAAKPSSASSGNVHGGRAASLSAPPVGLLHTHASSAPKDINPLSGLASYYGHGEQTATGEDFDPRGMTAAHRTLPFGTKVKVTRVDTGDSVVVRINDRGPFKPGRVIDLSEAAAENLGITTAGLAAVKLEVVGN